MAQQLQTFTSGEDFAAQLRSDEIQKQLRQQLTADISLERFTNVVVRAVQEDPTLLRIDNKKSIFLACQRAAQDGLLPDGREGALIIYNEKVGSGQWESAVRWEPMIGGLRKRLARLGFDIVAHPVYEADECHVQLGDDEKIVHTRAQFGTKKGELVGVYAIATRRSDGRKWHEPMDIEDIGAVKAVSKSGDRGPWGTFFSEMARKTVAKRLIKTLPLEDVDEEFREEAELLADMISRDNQDGYDFDQPPEPSEAARKIQSDARASKKKTTRKVAKKKATKKAAPEPKTEAPPEPSSEPQEPAAPSPSAGESEEHDVKQSEVFQGIDPGF